MQLIKISILFVLLFVLFYLEPIPVFGDITFSQMWKIPLFLFLLWQTILVKRKQKLNFMKWGYARAAKNLITGGFMKGYFLQLIDFIRYMMLPLLYDYISRKIKRIDRIDHLLIAYAWFIILSGVPFILGVLKSLGKVAIELDDFSSYTGVFQGAHSASITTCSAILILIYYYRFNPHLVKYKLLWITLILLGTYLLYLTFVRTGYLMFVLGLVVLFMPRKITMAQWIGWISVVLVLGIGFNYLLETNEQFYNRIFDIRNGRETAIGSGRLIFWQASYDMWINADAFEFLFGFGFEGFTENMRQLTGLKIYAHNEFFTQLGQNGLIGVVLLFGYVYHLLKFILKRRHCTSFKLSIMIFALNFSLMMTQGGVWFPFEVFMALVFCKLQMEHLVHSNRKQTTSQITNHQLNPFTGNE